MKSVRHLTPPATVRLKRVAAIPERVRLMELGFLPGADIHVMSRGATGGFLVAVGDSRIAIGDRTAGGLEIVDA
ncbi:ferrous iron transport protein A [Nonomuraea indica]|uniref:Ferrous iron transport protein A n=1 Tax=Nonomuraea indica TaxID=1581193 RepID=A0ABW8AGE0_9ACTN